MSRKAKTEADSKSFREGISPGGGVSWGQGAVGEREGEGAGGRVPFTILQKMQAADDIVLCRRGGLCVKQQ
jgi:hypothetical protein